MGGKGQRAGPLVLPDRFLQVSLRVIPTQQSGGQHSLEAGSRTEADRDRVRLRDELLVIGGLSGRKFRVATIVMGQSWKGAVVDSTEMRALVGAQAVFRM